MHADQGYHHADTGGVNRVEGRMKEQRILQASPGYEELDRYLAGEQIKKVLLVCDCSIQFLRINDYFDALPGRHGIEVVRFSGFHPNPVYDSVVEGIRLFWEERCDAVIVVGGGSAMDVAKCIKLYSGMDPQTDYLSQEIVPNEVRLVAVPTTAGTGSEATRFAVIYRWGKKQSITDDSCIPDAVLMDNSALKTLPIYQRKATMLDAFCHALESFWSVNSTEESRKYSREAMSSILRNWDGYLANEDDGNAGMMMAAHTAGKAINITQTTAGHAMCYKLTSLYGIAHGHAAAICDAVLFPYMVENLDECIDPRGKGYLEDVYRQIARAIGCSEPPDAAEKFRDMVMELGLEIPVVTEEEYAELRRSVNPIRLRNHPIRLEEETIDMLYHRILKSR